jgi:hypothetical protein
MSSTNTAVISTHSVEAHAHQPVAFHAGQLIRIIRNGSIALLTDRAFPQNDRNLNNHDVGRYVYSTTFSDKGVGCLISGISPCLLYPQPVGRAPPQLSEHHSF